MGFSMDVKKINLADQISLYDNEEFLNSISLKNITNAKDLKSLLLTLEKANYVVTNFYELMYSDYIAIINSSCKTQPVYITKDAIVKYRSLASRIQKAYNYVLYLNTFDNPFALKSRK